MFKNYQVSVDVYPMATVNGWSSLLHIGLGGNIDVGDRNPAIFFHSDSFKLHLTSNINGNPNSVFDTEALTPGKWTTIVIQQQQGQFLKSIITPGRDQNVVFLEIGMDFNNRDQEWPLVRIRIELWFEWSSLVDKLVRASESKNLYFQQKNTLLQFQNVSKHSFFIDQKIGNYKND